MPATVVQDWAAATTGATASPANVTVQLGGTGSTAATAGNLLLVAVNSDATVTTPSGYTLITSSIHNAGCYLYGKVAAGGETSVTVSPTVAASTSAAIAEIGGLSGATVANILDKTATNGSSTGSATRSTGTTAATTQADEYAVAVWGYSVTTTSFPADFGTGGGNKWSGQTNSFVEKIDTGTTKSSATNVGLCIAVKDLSATGTVESTATVINNTVVPSESLIATFKVAAGGTTPKPVGETGSSAEALAADAAAAISETAAAGDAAAVTATAAAGDSATASDSLAAAVAVALPDAGAASESPAESVTVPLGDTASAGDAVSNGLGTAKSLADAGSSAEGLTVAASAALADAASATDTRTSSATVPLSDAGAAADAVDNGLGTSKQFMEAGVGTEALTSSATVPLGDVAAAADALTVAAASALADAASAIDSASVAALVALAESGAAGQQIAEAVALALADAGLGADSGIGQDVANVSKSLGDTSSAADQISFVHALTPGIPTVTGDDQLSRVTGDSVTATVT